MFRQASSHSQQSRKLRFGGLGMAFPKCDPQAAPKIGADGLRACRPWGHTKEVRLLTLVSRRFFGFVSDRLWPGLAAMALALQRLILLHPRWVHKVPGSLALRGPAPCAG